MRAAWRSGVNRVGFLAAAVKGSARTPVAVGVDSPVWVVLGSLPAQVGARPQLAADGFAEKNPAGRGVTG